MENRWILLIDKYEGISKRGTNMLSAFLSGYLKYVLPVKLIDKTDLDEVRENNIIVVGKAASNTILAQCKERGFIDVPKENEGYSIYVGESILNVSKQMIAIAGADESGVLYGCMDFCNKYCGDIIYRQGDLWEETFFDTPFNRQLNSWKISVAPAIKTRAIWTWGHVIYDYRRFFDNMAKLRLNEVVIWNDKVPLNAKDAVEYAHSLGIKVVFGFAWGWSTDCAEILEQYNEQVLLNIKNSVLKTYESEYALTGCDGIYFQSFTELGVDWLGGKCIAELVTELVNDISAALLSKYPDLHIQFGLHATSVKTHLDILSRVDKRVYIVWENCGSFPYDYYADIVTGFDETYKFNERLLKLRGEDENFGAVLKGMLKLDWTRFEHFKDNYIMGERTNSYLKVRQINKNKIWKTVQSNWLKNAEYVRKIIELIAKQGKSPIVQALVEDAMFENEIMLPVALYAEFLWTPQMDTAEAISQVSKYPSVNFANI